MEAGGGEGVSPRGNDAEVDGLLAAARQDCLTGKWNDIVRKLERRVTAGDNKCLSLAAYYYLALFRLRRYARIAEHIEQVRFQGPSPDRAEAETEAPFVLQWVHAEYPIHLGDLRKGLDRLYGLLHGAKGLQQRYYEKMQSDVGSADLVPVSDVETVRLDLVGTLSLQQAWERRAQMLTCVIACHHCAQKQYGTALKHLSGLVGGGAGADPHYLALMAHVLLQLGDVRSARKMCDLLRSAGASGGHGGGGEGGGNQHGALLANLEGLLLFASDDFQEAIPKFEQAAALAPGMAAGHNNVAVGHMYAKNLHVSIKLLENKLAQNNTFVLQRAMVLNLCSMYELASTRCNESKQTLHSWILKRASDDFDPSTTRLA